MRGRYISVVGVLVLIMAMFGACYPFQGTPLQLLTPVPTTPLPPEKVQQAIQTILGQPSPSVAAETGVTAVVTVPSLRVRKEASPQAPVIAGLREGQEVPVMGRTADGVWYMVQVPEIETTGFVASEFVELQGSLEQVPVVDATGQVTMPEAAMAEEPTPAPTEAPVEATPTATQVPTPEATPTPEEAMAEATPAPGLGARFNGTPVDQLAVVAVRSLRVRVAPSTERRVMAGAREGETYPVAEQTDDGSWTAIYLPGFDQVGWVRSEYLRFQETDAVVHLGTATVNTGGPRLRVRSAPSLDAPIVGYVYPGERYATVAMSPDGKWVLLLGTDIPGPTWVSTDYVVLGPPAQPDP